MTLAQYLMGVVGLALALGPALFAVSEARRRWVGDRERALDRLVEAAMLLVMVFAIGLSLGAVGGLRPLPVLVGTWLVSAATILIARRDAPAGAVSTSPAPARDVPAASGAASSASVSASASAASAPSAVSAADPALAARPDPTAWLAGIGVAALLWLWMGHVVRSYRDGMLDGDSLWYHLPFAARFVQDGLITRPHPVNGDPLVAFFPANNELLHALVMLPFHRDVVSPVLNLAWLALALLAGWCIGRSVGRGPLGVLAVTAALSIPLMTFTQAGTGRNDLAGVTLLLVAVALFVQARRPDEPVPPDLAGDDDAPGADGDTRPTAASLVLLGLGGAMLGLSVGVKVSLLVPAGLLFLGGLVVLALDARRRRARWGGLVAWTVPTAVLGCYWYVRNWVAVGNPLPWLAVHLGPIRFTAAPLPKGAISNSSVADRIGESGGWAKVLAPGLRYGIGPLWPLAALAVLALVVLALMAGRTRTSRMLTVVGAIGLVAYLPTPNTAPERTGVPLAAEIFILNGRYAIPALMLVLAGAVLAVGERRGTAAANDRVALVVAGGLLAVTGLELAQRALGTSFEWKVTGGQRLSALVFVLLAAVAAAVLWRLRDRPVLLGPAVVAVVAVVVIAGYPVSHSYLANAYTGPPPFPAARAWPLGRQLDQQRVGLYGDFFQYPFVGPELGNWVQYVGVPGPHGAFGSPTTCGQWRRALDREQVGWVVIAPQLFTGASANGGPVAWTASIPGARDQTAPSFRAVGGRAFQLPPDRSIPNTC